MEKPPVITITPAQRKKIIADQKKPDALATLLKGPPPPPITLQKVDDTHLKVVLNDKHERLPDRPGLHDDMGKVEMTAVVPVKKK